MYLVWDDEIAVFTDSDPRLEGYKGRVEEGVTLETEALGDSRWNDGEARPVSILGVLRSDPKRYKVFRDAESPRREGYTVIEGTPCPVDSWSRYRAQFRRETPPGSAR